MTIRVTYVLLVDGYCKHPEGELILMLEDWLRLKQYHVAIAQEYISCNASGGVPANAIAILASKGARFTKFGNEPAHSVFAPEDD